MEPTTKRFEKKEVIVTGAGSGIGQAIALRLCSEGANVWAWDLGLRQLDDTFAKAKGLAGTLIPVACDITSFESVRDAMSTPSKIDVLVNNAGVAHVGNVEKVTPDDLDRLYRVNVKGVYHCLFHAVPRMVEKGGGAILNLASIASKIGIQDRFAYSMTKGAVYSMTLSIARDYVARGIRCNCVCPARVHTPFVDGFIAREYPGRRDEMLEKLSAYQPIGRMGKPEEIASTAAFLCSEEASFITGSAYDIDGGVTLLR